MQLMPLGLAGEFNRLRSCRRALFGPPGSRVRPNPGRDPIGHGREATGSADQWPPASQRGAKVRGKWPGRRPRRRAGRTTFAGRRSGPSARAVLPGPRMPPHRPGSHTAKAVRPSPHARERPMIEDLLNAPPERVVVLARHADHSRSMLVTDIISILHRDGPSPWFFLAVTPGPRVVDEVRDKNKASGDHSGTASGVKVPPLENRMPLRSIPVLGCLGKIDALKCTNELAR